MEKPKKHIILNITNQGIFYNPTECIEWQNTNFPPKTNFSFNEREKIYWAVEMLSYSKNLCELNVRVSSYDATYLNESFLSQNPKYPIKALKFRELDWQELMQVMNFYTPAAFEGLIKAYEEPTKKELKEFDFGSNPGQKIDTKNSKSIKINFKYPLMKTKFKMGYVEIKKKLKGIIDPVTIQLENSNIIPEFDHVKPYFAKILGKKKIEVEGYLEFAGNNELKIRCHSKEINRIDEKLITSVKSIHLRKAIFSPKLAPVDKSLFTPEEFFEEIQDLRLGNTTKKSEKEILDEIFDLPGIRNKKQLIYLSGILQSEQTRLKFTLSPKFGFLFNIEGEEMHHFIWELLDTNATYIWSMPKALMPIEKKFKLLEREINFIRENGRMSYLSNTASSEFIFNKVNHENATSKIVDGFPLWKARLNEKLV